MFAPPFILWGVFVQDTNVTERVRWEQRLRRTVVWLTVPQTKALARISKKSLAPVIGAHTPSSERVLAKKTERMLTQGQSNGFDNSKTNKRLALVVIHCRAAGAIE